jgi:hypothetical protein
MKTNPNHKNNSAKNKHELASASLQLIGFAPSRPPILAKPDGLLYNYTNKSNYGRKE